MIQVIMMNSLKKYSKYLFLLIVVVLGNFFLGQTKNPPELLGIKEYALADNGVESLGTELSE